MRPHELLLLDEPEQRYMEPASWVADRVVVLESGVPVDAAAHGWRRRSVRTSRSASGQRSPVRPMNFPGLGRTGGSAQSGEEIVLGHGRAGGVLDAYE
ncbi:MAG TPA: hypothetical protein VGO89_21285, partial [Streptomyces sp.]|nr:hypothetical protein [Streptomyces sp.]